MRWVTAALCAAALFTLTGCWDRTELEEEAFVPSLAIDVGPARGLFVYTFRIAVPRQLAGSPTGNPGGSGNGGDTEKGSKTVSVMAHSLGEAINLTNSTVERRLNFVHCQYVLFGEELARQGVSAHLQDLLRFRQFRRTMFMAVVKGRASDSFKENKPVLENSITRYIEDLQKIRDFTGMEPIVHLHSFVRAVQSEVEDAYTSVVAINEEVKRQDKQKEPQQQGSKQETGKESETSGEKERSQQSFRDRTVTFEAGRMRRIGGNPEEFPGAAVFRGDRLAAFLNGEEARLMLALRGELLHAFLTVQTPQGRFTIEAREQGRPQIVEVAGGDRPVWRVRPKFEVDVVSAVGAFDTRSHAGLTVLQREAETWFNRQAEALIGKVQRELGADPFRFGLHARRRFWTEAGWKSFDWPRRYRELQIQVDSRFVVRRIGNQLVSSAVR
ncbi:MAG: Ger(x)C family spore germination protein [Alicyclobacillaceae bacterium]|nr:Ger(x)C family spore germination protein [Alicyclobacillaceae bacterium]